MNLFTDISVNQLWWCSESYSVLFWWL